MQLIRKFAKDESGATAIEYGLIASGIAAAILLSLQVAGGGLKNTFNYLASGLSNSQR